MPGDSDEDDFYSVLPAVLHRQHIEGNLIYGMTHSHQTLHVYCNTLPAGNVSKKIVLIFWIFYKLRI